MQNDKPTSILDGKEQCEPLSLDHSTTKSRYIAEFWWSSQSMDLAAKLSDIETLKLLHRTNFKCCSSMVMGYAIENGRLDVIQWLHDNQKEGCSELDMHRAAENGHFEIVKLLHENRDYNFTSKNF
ncbi:hypothetical protein THRCLA_23315 [Thraustotheca clavata]|uniref:Uncharacterized protein n=1 Tax=Thraustotheca clavata TaxID=74557 RepID=A0A1V9Y7K7_9STRA|nr:hypothetical protein THRCLA_23315 [Thraustotheca clavata]